MRRMDIHVRRIASENAIVRDRLSSKDAGWQYLGHECPSYRNRCSNLVTATIPAVYSSSARSFAITFRSSSVDVSEVDSRPAATSRNRRRMIFPLRVFGSAAAKRT